MLVALADEVSAVAEVAATVAVVVVGVVRKAAGMKASGQAVRTAALGVLVDAALTAEPAAATPDSRRLERLLKTHGRATPILKALGIEPDELAALCVRVMRSRR